MSWIGDKRIVNMNVANIYPKLIIGGAIVKFKKKNSPKQKKVEQNICVNSSQNINTENSFVLTGLGNGSAWSLDNSRIKDFSFEKLYNHCSL